MEFSKTALRLILDAEGIDQPSQFPGGDSGISLGRGYDLGQESTFRTDWRNVIADSYVPRLCVAIGLKGKAAAAIAHKFSDIFITTAQADYVFTQVSLPKYVDLTRKTFPGFDDLPLDAQGALVSLIYNRGTSMDGDRRREMRDLVPAVADCELQKIADLIRSMKRLWIGGPDPGLVTRRENEARLVESCLPATII